MENEERLEPVEEEIVEQVDEQLESMDTPIEDETSSEDVTEEAPKKLSRRKRRRLKWLAFDPEHDIKYRGPFSYRTLRIFAWLFLALAQLGTFIAFAGTKDPSIAAKYGTLATILSGLKSVMMPLFLIATFSLLLNKSKKFSSLLIMYGGFAILLFLLFVLIHDRYMIGLFMKMSELDRQTATETLDALLGGFLQNGYISFNIFIDLFSCTLFVFFLNYEPKKIFTGKKVIIFRLFILVPIFYEIICIVLKALTSLGTMTMPTYMFPFLTTKPPMTFVVFVVLACYITFRGKLYNKHGLSTVEYDEFLKSNRNSWNFSSFTASTIAVAVVIDGILLLVLGLCLTNRFPAEEPMDSFRQALSMVNGMGFGAAIPMVFVIPFVLLFSYTRVHKDSRIDLIIPVLGIVLLVLIYLEELYQILLYGASQLAGIMGE